MFKRYFNIFKFKLIKSCSSKQIMSNCFKADADRFIWIDLEMTGLNIEIDKILEIACLVTDSNLVQLDEGLGLVINQSEDDLSSMTDWCKIHHAKNGLTKDCRESKITMAEAEAQIFNYIQSHTNEKCTNYLAGNTVYMDLLFLKKFFPSLTNFFHYRLLDVSALKILVSQWKPNEFEQFSKKTSHRALEDIHSSINELKYYRKLLF